MERKIGEIFECNGVKLRVEKGTNACDGCYFKGVGKCNHYRNIRDECLSASINEGVIFKKVDDVEERVIKLTLEKAKEFYKKGGDFKDLALSAFTKEELEKVNLPKTWEEFCELYNIISLNECYIDLDCTLKGFKTKYNRHPKLDRNVVPSKEAAEAHLALMQLHQLRDCYRQGWKPDWNNGESAKHCIIKTNGDYYVLSLYGISSFLSFQSLEIAHQFLNNFRDLIIKAGDLI